MTNPKVRFIKVQGSWYADLPEYIAQGGSFASCLMVAGAPELIEILIGITKNKNKDELTVEISTEWFPGFEAVLNKEVEGDDVMEEEEGSWAVYLTTIYNRPLTQAINKPGSTNVTGINMKVGLCPVNAWVFQQLGETGHPNTIYIKAVREK
jgi:hypothetical protein